MKITALKKQVKNPNRVSVYVDGKYSFSLDVNQLIDLKLRNNLDLDEESIQALKSESDFGKIYARSVDYCLVRPRSQKEICDYLNRKKVPVDLSERVLNRLLDKKFVDDFRFAEFWVETRRIKKGASKIRLVTELKSKGISNSIIDQIFAETDRNETDDLDTVIMKKRAKYDDIKLIQYLARQGFRYDHIKDRLNYHSENSDTSG